MVSEGNPGEGLAGVSTGNSTTVSPLQGSVNMAAALSPVTSAILCHPCALSSFCVQVIPFWYRSMSMLFHEGHMCTPEKWFIHFPTMWHIVLFCFVFFLLFVTHHNLIIILKGLHWGNGSVYRKTYILLLITLKILLLILFSLFKTRISNYIWFVEQKSISCLDPV